MSNYDTLVTKVQELNDLGKAVQLLQWDRETNMPKNGNAERIQQMATLMKIGHQMGTSDEFGKMIESASAELNGIDPNSTQARLIKIVKRDYNRARAFPEDFVRRRTIISGQAQAAWTEARAQNDFPKFQPHLEKIIELCQEMTDYLDEGADEQYDTLLNLYEEGMKAADVRRLFDAVKAETVPLLRAIEERGTPIDTALLHKNFPIDSQIKFAHYISRQVGYDLERGHIGTVTHPFASSFSRNDARITSRWYGDFVNPGLFGTLHESGHAMYEQGTAAEFSRTPLARGASLGLHESQSRTIENIIGRSLGFWHEHYDALQKTFPDLADHSVEEFYRAINHVQPSFIRVEADELTYNFHIILRFELEQAMLSGELAAKDLPAAWNAKMEELLGIVPPNDSQGCLQDVHWSRPMFGYFPTYALGNLYGAQFYEAIQEQSPAAIEDLNVGKPEQYVEWLRENIHIYGSKLSPTEIVMNATGKPLSHEPFVRYVTNKFTEIYEL